jgi:E3 ubiquitin-protein ligase UBR4
LACSFLLSNPELLNYDEFYNAVVAMVAVGSQRDKFLGTSWTLLDACCVRYHFNISWRLLGCLPLSADFLRRLESGIPSRVSDGPALLHAIKWTSRLPQKIFQVS